MLSPTDRDNIQSATENLVATLGVPATWKQTKDPQATQDIIVGFKSIGWKDQELINAFGIGAKVLTIRVSELANIDKFDTITVNGERYTIDTVMPVHLNGVHLLHKCYIRGK